MNPLQQLDEILMEKARDWSLEDRNLITATAADLTALMARELTGEDVKDEINTAKATAENIAAGSAVNGAQVLNDWFSVVVNALLARL